MSDFPQVHLDKLLKTLESPKLPECDKAMVEEAIKKYADWKDSLDKVSNDSLDSIISDMISLLNEYKLFIDMNLIFDSNDDFLYRQKGQLKIDNTVIEDFLPILVKKCIEYKYGQTDLNINSQTSTFSSVYFKSSLNNPEIGGGLNIKTKAQDFSISRKLYIKSSYKKSFEDSSSVIAETNLGYVVTECKTNLDKTMYQEASATAHDIKTAVTGAKYFLLCEWLDMTPISTATTDIDEIIILRKAKRLSSNIRNDFSDKTKRHKKRKLYLEYLQTHPYSFDMFKRFIEHIFALLNDEDLIEEDILQLGYF
jgi:hypothetical protein